MSNLRRQALSAFKKLHRTRQYVFDGDVRALEEARQKINDEFRQNRVVTDQDDIQNKIKLAEECAQELRANVIQAHKREDGVYELRITPETTRMDNVVFNPDAIIESPRKRRGAKPAEGCCGGAAMAALEAEVAARKK
ncbi:complex III assembly factor LYRM7 [Drosophila pseudoobscura]|uniref:Complex III assembly factor LYRM7 n=1 Tax=Drosophila pseudoobscura pseudoobscura TaxID=46245 RepID=A0A6I8WDY4_DROPS|nr:complex III assembly factor LYRM7 [Drosophila pseudoobscura]